MNSETIKSRPLPDPAVKIQVLEGLAGAWNDAGLKYAVTNGLQGYPGGIGRDIDVVFERRDLRKAVTSTVSFLEREGFMVVPYHLAWVYWLVGFRRASDGSIDSVQIDLFDHLQWAFSWIIDGDEAGTDREMAGPFQTDPWASVGKRLMLNAISKNYDTFRKKAHYLEVSENELKSLESNFVRLSGHPFKNLQTALKAGDLKEIEAIIPSFRKAVFRRSLTNPAKILRRFHSAWLKQWCVNLKPVRTAPIISINSASDERLEDLTDEIEIYLQNHLVFTCDSPRDVEGRYEGMHDLRIFGDLWRGHLRRDCKRSALQVIQIYRNHPSGNVHGRTIVASHWLNRILPRPDLIVDLDACYEIKSKEDLGRLLVDKLYDWFAIESRKRRLN